ncbi:hypothetical protein [Rhizobium tumorigenes]|nr:hypothetical protein [Rhizobium tumorigenes]WFS04041.1 hypothetical protein PR016_24945 [Rhizobium tumorigenes]
MNFDHHVVWITDICIHNWDVKHTPEWCVACGKLVLNCEPEYQVNI